MTKELNEIDLELTTNGMDGEEIHEKILSLPQQQALRKTHLLLRISQEVVLLIGRIYQDLKERSTDFPADLEKARLGQRQVYKYIKIYNTFREVKFESEIGEIGVEKLGIIASEIQPEEVGDFAKNGSFRGLTAERIGTISRDQLKLHTKETNSEGNHRIKQTLNNYHKQQRRIRELEAQLNKHKAPSKANHLTISVAELLANLRMGAQIFSEDCEKLDGLYEVSEDSREEIAADIKTTISKINRLLGRGRAALIRKRIWPEQLK